MICTGALWKFSRAPGSRGFAWRARCLLVGVAAGVLTAGSASAQFVKVSPADGATNQPLSLTLTWAPDTQSVLYEYLLRHHKR